jgi:hypothetical protein
MDSEYFERKKEKAKKVYATQRTIPSPYFKQEIILNADGFHHLRYSARRERNKQEQVLKFTLLPLALRILKAAATVQEYRKLYSLVGGKSKGGFTQMKMVQWWGFVTIFIEQEIKVRVVVRKVGEGNLHFWSVMPYSKLRRDKKQKLFTEGIEDD